MIHPRAPPLVVDEEKRKAFCNIEELSEIQDHVRKEKQHLYPVMSPAQFSPLFRPCPPFKFCFFPLYITAEQILPSCNDSIPILSDPDDKFKPLTPSAPDVIFIPIVIFFSPPTYLIQESALPTSPDNQQKVTTASLPSSPTTLPSLLEGLPFTKSPLSTHSVHFHKTFPLLVLLYVIFVVSFHAQILLQHALLLTIYPLTGSTVDNSTSQGRKQTKDLGFLNDVATHCNQNFLGEIVLG